MSDIYKILKDFYHECLEPESIGDYNKCRCAEHRKEQTNA